MRIVIATGVLFLLGSLLTGCKQRDPLLRHYLEHRDAIVARDWEWIASHLSHDFLATHVADLLRASDSVQAFNEQQTMFDQATYMKDDAAICAARSTYASYGRKGALNLVVRRSDGDVKSVTYEFEQQMGSWRLARIVLLARTAKDQVSPSACHAPLIDFDAKRATSGV